MNLHGPIDCQDTAHRVGISFAGCPYRGTMTCWLCTFEPVKECGYQCGDCPERYRCKCGWDRTEMLKTMELI